MMRAIIQNAFGGPEVLQLGEAARPSPGPNQILVEVKATALNRADTMQRQGLYPPPPGASEILGLEISGIVSACGEACRIHKPGDRVFGLVPGGAYAEYALIDEQMAWPIPETWDFTQAAAIPEVFLTAYQAIFWLGHLKNEESILIHAGASGVGTAAIQIAREEGAKIFCTASASKHEICKNLGAHHCIDYKSQDFLELVQTVNEGKGVDLIIDFIAAAYWHQNIELLNPDGRLVLLALMGGVTVDQFNMIPILRKRLHIKGSTLRARSLAYQRKLAAEFIAYALPKFAQGQLKPIIDTVFSWKEVVKAHQYMETNQNKGKIIMQLDT